MTAKPALGKPACDTPPFLWVAISLLYKWFGFAMLTRTVIKQPLPP
jgi:hypothetical protein